MQQFFVEELVLQWDYGGLLNSILLLVVGRMGGGWGFKGILWGWRSWVVSAGESLGWLFLAMLFRMLC